MYCRKKPTKTGEGISFRTLHTHSSKTQESCLFYETLVTKDLSLDDKSYKTSSFPHSFTKFVHQYFRRGMTQIFSNGVTNVHLRITVPVVVVVVSPLLCPLPGHYNLRTEDLNVLPRTETLGRGNSSLDTHNRPRDSPPKVLRRG